MTRPNLTPKRIATDIAGWVCIIASPLLGWLPGPGGIPLFLAGLGLLSINNAWAKRLLHWVRERSDSLREILFPDIRPIQWAWDLLAVVLIVCGTLFSSSVSGWPRLLAIPLYSVALIIFLFNRHRLRWLEGKMPRLKRNKK